MDLTNGSLDRFTQALGPIVDKLTAAGHADEAEALTAIHDDLKMATDTLNGLVSPFIEELKAWRLMFWDGFEGKINGNIPFMIQGKAQAKQ